MKRNLFYDIKHNLSLQDILKLFKNNLRIVFLLTLIFYLFPVCYFIFNAKEYRGKLRIQSFPALINEQYYIDGVKTLNCWESEFHEYIPRIFEKKLYINAVINEMNNQNFLSRITYLIKNDFEQVNKKNIDLKFDYLKSNLALNFDPKQFNYIDIFVSNEDFEYVKKSLFYIDKELNKTINSFQQNLISSEIDTLEKLVFELEKKREFVFRKRKQFKSNLEKFIFDANINDHKFLSSKRYYKNNFISLIKKNDIDLYTEYLQKLSSIRDEESCINVALMNNKKSLSLHNQLLKSGDKANLFINSKPLLFYSNYRKFNKIKLVTSLLLSFLMANVTSLFGFFFFTKINLKK